MPVSIRFIHISLLCGWFIYPHIAQADGLSDLKTALTRLHSSEHIRAELEVTSVNSRGEGDDKIDTLGRVNVQLVDDKQGLQVLYSNAVLTQLDLEARLKAEDENAETQTLNAIDGINATELHSMLSASSSILRDINQATFIDESEQKQNNQVLRLLRFKLPIEFFIDDKKIRGYVKKFDANYHIWTDLNGTPVKSEMDFSGKGRAYIFFSISASGALSTQYQVINNRLVVMRSDRNSHNNNTFGVFSRSSVKTLHLQSDVGDALTVQVDRP